ncbi:MAG: LacI family DNA-binding transcriptional regulator [Spirochaetales bacterium]|nr:LacI family DNA-binding transcriptional regulator [Spirochaetales bacterium]
MSERKSTIYDVAKKSETSITTVSRVLNNPDKVAADTKEKIYKAMKELGFVPKAEARERAKKNIGRIGVITPFLTHPSFMHRLKGITDGLKATPYELTIITVANKTDINDYLRSINLTNRLDGIIVISQKLSRESIRLIKELKIKTIFIEFEEHDFPGIFIDNTKGGEFVAEYLHDKGFKTFSVLTEQDIQTSESPNILRVNGFRKRLLDFNKKIDDSEIFFTNNNFDQALEVAKEIVSREILPEVVFATTDLLAVAMLKAARNRDLEIPKDLGIIGFDGTDTSEYMDITTVDQSLEVSGKLAAELLINYIENPDFALQKTYLPLNVIERSTIK